MSRWMENATTIREGKPPHILIDLGYVNNPVTRENADKLKARGIGKRNFELAGFGRLLVRLPPSKAKTIMAEFPIKLIKDASGYVWCTHSWLERGNNNLEYAFQ